MLNMVHVEGACKKNPSNIPNTFIDYKQVQLEFVIDIILCRWLPFEVDAPDRIKLCPGLKMTKDKHHLE